MGLQLFSPRPKEDDSFNETNVEAVARNAVEMRYGLSVYEIRRRQKLLHSIETAKAEYSYSSENQTDTSRLVKPFYDFSHT